MDLGGENAYRTARRPVYHDELPAILAGYVKAESHDSNDIVRSVWVGRGRCAWTMGRNVSEAPTATSDERPRDWWLEGWRAAEQDARNAQAAKDSRPRLAGRAVEDAVRSVRAASSSGVLQVGKADAATIIATLNAALTMLGEPPL